MSKLVYWKIQSLDDHNCYSRRFRTKKEAMEEWVEMLKAGDAELYADGEWAHYSPPKKVEVFYSGGCFGLLAEILSEAGEPYGHFSNEATPTKERLQRWLKES